MLLDFAEYEIVSLTKNLKDVTFLETKLFQKQRASQSYAATLANASAIACVCDLKIRFIPRFWYFELWYLP